jgi:hypothetical protein
MSSFMTVLTFLPPYFTTHFFLSLGSCVINLFIQQLYTEHFTCGRCHSSSEDSKTSVPGILVILSPSHCPPYLSIPVPLIKRLCFSGLHHIADYSFVNSFLPLEGKLPEERDSFCDLYIVGALNTA